MKSSRLTFRINGNQRNQLEKKSRTIDATPSDTMRALVAMFNHDQTVFNIAKGLIEKMKSVQP